MSHTWGSKRKVHMLTWKEQHLETFSDSCILSSQLKRFNTHLRHKELRKNPEPRASWREVYADPVLKQGRATWR